MLRRLLPLSALVLVALVGCADQTPISPDANIGSPQFAISDGARGGTPEFFWLAPTVATSPVTSGITDDTALPELAVEVCRLDAAATCAGAPIQRFTATTLPIPERVRYDASTESYAVNWMSGASQVKAGEEYRITVRRGAIALGFVDVAVVQTPPALAGVDASRFTGLVKGQQFPVRFRIERPSARNYVKVNEVESNQGVPGDWVEFHNTADVAFDLGGYIFRDDNDTRGYTIPAGTMIAPRGFLVFDEEQFDFGLGSNDNARLFAPDGATLVDNYAWSGGHAATTYGRCPDGTGAFATTSIVTKGTANDCSPLVRINEIESSGGTPGDWIELYNQNAVAVDLGGHIVRDNDDTRGYTIPAGTTLAPGAFLIIEEAQLGFGLGGADAVRLFRPNGVALVDSYSWTAHATTTYGRCPDGTGGFVTTAGATKGGANLCSAPVSGVVVNEVESNGGTPGDWVELLNTGASAVDLSGYFFKDNDDSRTFQLPAGTIVAAGAFLVIEEAQFGFGLGAADAARLIAPNGTTVVASHDWTAHATTTYGRCPDGTGAFVTTTSSTKGAANDCSAAVRINEVESSGGTPGDWVELINNGTTPLDLSGYYVKDNDDTRTFQIAAGTIVAPGGYLVLDETTFGFGLGSGDAARLFAPNGTTLVDSYTWTAHASTTYGRCPNGTGSFTTTTAPTKGGVNACPGDLVVAAWAGDATVVSADPGGSLFGGNMSGLTYVGSGTAAPGVLFASRNGPGAMFRLVWNGSVYAPDAANNWNAGKLLRYPSGTGDVDAEGVVVIGNDLFVAAERNNAASGVSRNSVLRFDATAAGTELIAVQEWNLTADLPTTAPNAGLEAIAFVPDGYLTANGFRDEATGLPYNPALYPNHGGGLFLVGLEANGGIYAYALDQVSGAFTRVATITSGYTGVMDLEWDPELQQLWAVCDDTCLGRSALLAVDATPGSPTQGQFVVQVRYERPTGMPNINNEGFAVARQAECVAAKKPAYWADDNQTGGVSLRRGTVSCTAP